MIKILVPVPNSVESQGRRSWQNKEHLQAKDQDSNYLIFFLSSRQQAESAQLSRHARKTLCFIVHRLGSRIGRQFPPQGNRLCLAKIRSRVISATEDIKTVRHLNYAGKVNFCSRTNKASPAG
jgi:hypothetical protein